jgi:hypothetical protein
MYVDSIWREKERRVPQHATPPSAGHHWIFPHRTSVGVEAQRIPENKSGGWLHVITAQRRARTRTTQQL